MVAGRSLLSLLRLRAPLVLLLWLALSSPGHSAHPAAPFPFPFATRCEARSCQPYRLQLPGEVAALKRTLTERSPPRFGKRMHSPAKRFRTRSSSPERMPPRFGKRGPGPSLHL